MSTCRALAALTFVVPLHERDELARMPDDVQEEVRAMLLRCRVIASAPRGQITATIKKLCRPGLSGAHLRRKWDEYQLGNARYAAGDWRVFINHCKVPELRVGGMKGIPPEFRDFWQELQKENQRKSRPAHRKLRQMWRGGESIPGYGTWQEWYRREHPGRPLPPRCPEDLPRGWSYDNLMDRRNAAAPVALAAARLGPGAVDEYRMLTYTTRVGLLVGQFYQFDDNEFDAKVNFPGQRKAMRSLGLDCLDVKSAYACAYGFKPTLWDDVEKAKQKLKEVDMLWLVVQVLTTIGYRTDEIGTTLLVEMGTAAISEDFARRILEATDGHVRVLRGESKDGMQSPFHGVFEGKGKGNFRFKAHIESLRNLLRNEMADTALLPGQMGKDRNHQPEELHGRDKLNNRLLAVAQALSPEDAQALQMPMVPWHQWVRIGQRTYDAVNDRWEHDLEGWTESNHLAPEWRLDLDYPWLPWGQVLLMPPEKRAAVEAIIDTDARLWQTRKMTPREVFVQGQHELTLLPGCMLPGLLGPKFGVLRTCAAGRFVFEDQELDPTGAELRFTARIVTREGKNEPLEAGEYLTFVNPFSPDTLYACRPDGAYLGSCERETAPRRDDEEAMQRAWGAARKMESELAVVHARPGRAMWREMDRAKNNIALLDTAKPTPAERADTKRRRDAAAKISELLHGGLSVRGTDKPTVESPVIGAAMDTPECDTARAEDATPGPLW